MAAGLIILEGRAFAAETLRSLHAGGVMAAEFKGAEFGLMNVIYYD
jgi:hypothetical protein